jgi:hypothetical protein
MLNAAMPAQLCGKAPTSCSTDYSTPTGGSATRWSNALLHEHATIPEHSPALVRAATQDQAWQVRDPTVMHLYDFDLASVRDSLHTAASDEHPELR